MKAIQLAEPKQFRVIDVPEPPAPGPGEAFEQLALVETLGIGLHAINRANPKPDETVLVIGAGPIGLSVIEFAKLAGSRVVVMDLNEQRLKFAREKMGVAETISAQGLEADV